MRSKNVRQGDIKSSERMEKKEGQKGVISRGVTLAVGRAAMEVARMEMVSAGAPRHPGSVLIP